MPNVRKTIKWILILLAVAAVVLLFRWKAPKQEEVSLAQTNIEAAAELLDAYAEGRDTLLFYHQDIDEKRVYHLLQAQQPYYAILSTASFQNGSLQLTYEVPHKEMQQQGIEAAKKAGAEAAANENSIEGKLKAIHHALIRHCVYEQTGEDRVQMAAGAIEDGKAVCGGYARAFCAMCDGAGIDVYYIEDDDMTHAWNAVRLYGKTYFIDCTYDDPVPDQGKYVGDTYFMLTAEQLKQTHTWDTALYEEFLDSRYPEQFAYIQRMQDLQLADSALRASDTDTEAKQADLDKLNELLGTTIAESVMDTDENGVETCLTYGELYQKGYEALWDEVDGQHRIEELIDRYIVPPLAARSMGF